MQHRVQSCLRATVRSLQVGGVRWKEARVQDSSLNAVYPGFIGSSVPLVSVGSANILRQIHAHKVQDTSCAKPNGRSAEPGTLTLRHVQPITVGSKAKASSPIKARLQDGGSTKLRDYSANAQPSESSNDMFIKELLEALGKDAPIFPVRAENISFIQSPADFHQVRGLKPTSLRVPFRPHSVPVQPGIPILRQRAFDDSGVQLGK
eukprot:6235471-Pyramimonas_sp.AAC.2